MHYDHKNVEYARKLRKEVTPWERKLWYCYLNQYSIRFYRQVPIDKFIVDFYCPKANLVIELDGGGHYTDEQEKKDAARTKDLAAMNLTVLRICNLDIDRNFRGVCEQIDLTVKKRLG